MSDRGNQHLRLRAAGVLGLAAAPTFAAMALATMFLDDGKMAAVCSASQGPAWLGGMVPMYALMSAFHLSPWLNLLGTRRSSRPRAIET